MAAAKQANGTTNGSQPETESIRSVLSSALGDQQDAAGDVSNPSGMSLCFRPEVFLENGFSVDAFLHDCRRRVAMSELQEDLNKYHGSLSTAMFTLINKDYGDFVSLSSNLAGLDQSISDITSPMGDLKNELLTLKGTMDSEIEELESRLKKRVEIRDQRTMLQRFLNISASVDKIEKLLAGGTYLGENFGEQTDGAPVESDSLTTSGRGLIERVASEFNQLHFYVTQCQRAPFLDKIKPRIVKITTTLQEALERSFRTGIETNDKEVLQPCLRTYSIIDKIEDVETLFRDIVVLPYTSVHVTKEKFSATSLAELYDGIIKFIDEQCMSSVKIARQLNLTGCDFLVNAVWPELAESLSKIPAIFASGLPDALHKNFLTTEDFLTKFEIRCGTRGSVNRFRSHISYSTFRKRWSLPVYFQLRFQEIAGTFESKLNEPLDTQLIEDTSKSTQNPWHFNATSLVVDLIHRCWSPEVYLPGLSHRFWKLTLQLLARYGAWVSGLATKDQDKNSISTRSVLYLLQDGQSVCQLTRSLVDSTIYARFPSVKNSVRKEVLDDALEDCCTVITNATQAVKDSVVDTLAGSCKKVLRECLTIPKQYRHTKKPMASDPSPYVGKVLQSIKKFTDDYGQEIDDCQKEWILPLCEHITENFETFAQGILVAEDKMEQQLNSLKRIRKKKQDSETAALSDQEKIRLQLWIDVSAYVKELDSIGVTKDNLERLKTLQNLVEAAKPKGETT